jgi:hypothetical protein
MAAPSAASVSGPRRRAARRLDIQLRPDSAVLRLLPPEAIRHDGGAAFRPRRSMSDFGSRTGAAMLSQTASDAVILSLSRPLTWANAGTWPVRLTACSIRIEGITQTRSSPPYAPQRVWPGCVSAGRSRKQDRPPEPRAQVRILPGALNRAWSRPYADTPMLTDLQLYSEAVDLVPHPRPRVPVFWPLVQVLALLETTASWAVPAPDRSRTL